MPATHEKIAEFLGESSKWPEGVKSLIKWQFGLHGDFKESLWSAIKRADETNLHRLALGFPQEVHAFREWISGDLAEELRKAGLPI